MTAKFLRGPVAVLVFVMAISAAPSISMARNNQSKSQPAQSGSDKQAAPKINKAEEDAYKAFYAARSGGPTTQIQMGEDFVKKFPESHYLPGVYSQLATSYFSANDIDKMLVAGAKAIELNPDNVDVLALLAMVIPRRVQSTTPDGAQQIQKAEAYARHAIELIPNLSKPAEVDDATFEKAKNDKLSLAHSGLGLIDLNFHGKPEDARTELMQAVQLASSPDPVDYYLLGNADRQASYLNGAVAAYEKCAASGPLMARCKAAAESTKKDLTTALSKD